MKNINYKILLRAGMFFGIVFCCLFVCVETNAIVESQVDCSKFFTEKLSKGKKYAVFLISTPPSCTFVELSGKMFTECNDEPGDAQGDPVDGKIFCAIVDSSATSITLQNFLSGKPQQLVNGFKDSFVKREMHNCDPSWQKWYTVPGTQESKITNNYLFKFERTMSLACMENIEIKKVEGPAVRRLRYYLTLDKSKKILRTLYFWGFLEKSGVTCSSLTTKEECNQSQYCVFIEKNKLVNRNPGCYIISDLTNEERLKLMSDAQKAGMIDKYKVPEGYVGALPDCAFSGTCDDVNDLLQLMINFGKGFFAIVGLFAFAFFVYGGFKMATSFGNEERVKEGQQTLVAAVIGIIIVFCAYILVNFMLDALQVSPMFQGLKIGK
jgi:uncharacterized membrane protein YwzB